MSPTHGRQSEDRWHSYCDCRSFSVIHPSENNVIRFVSETERGRHLHKANSHEYGKRQRQDSPGAHVSS